MRNGLWAAIGILIAALGLLLARPAEAAPPAGGVVGFGTPGTCTQNALHTRLAGGGLVTFNCGGPATIVLSGTEVISLNTTLQGGGVITLSGGTTSGIFDVEGGVVSLSGLTLTEGFNKAGGAIYNNQGQVTVSDSRFVNNSAVVLGGAILSNVALTVTHSDFYSNTAGNGGGAVYAVVMLTVQDSSFEFNHTLEGGAIVYNTNAGLSRPAGAALQFTLAGSRFLSNTATAERGGAILTFGAAAISHTDFEFNHGALGGAVHNALDASLTVADSTFISNTADAGAGGAIYNLGHLVLSNSTFTSNTALDGGRGGGLAQGAAATALIASSTFTGNVAVIGGGLVTSGSLTLRNTTLTGNLAFGGGALLVASQAPTVTLTNNTLAGNGAVAGGDIYNDNGGPVLLKNNILSGLADNNCQGPITSLGHNLDNAHTCGLAASGDLTDTDPLLGPLAGNGGPTQTLALLPGSPAIDHGDSNGCPATDQRGFLRLGACDIGAFEFVYRTLLPLLRR